MWIHSVSVMAKRGRDSVAGEWKATLELADAMRAELDQYDTDDLKAMTIKEFQLRNRIRNDIYGGSIAYSKTLEDSVQCDSTYGMAALLKLTPLKLQIGLLCFVLSLIAPAIVNVIFKERMLYFINGFPIIAILLFTIGSSWKSNTVLFLWAIVIIPTILEIPFIVSGYNDSYY